MKTQKVSGVEMNNYPSNCFQEKGVGSSVRPKLFLNVNSDDQSWLN